MLTNNQGDNHSTVNFFLIRHRKQPKEKKCKQTKRKKRKKESNPFSVSKENTYYSAKASEKMSIISIPTNNLF